MKLLVATAETQGQRPGDFHWCADNELVMFGVICDTDRYADDAGTGGCGCGRSFTGLDSGKGTTTAVVLERDTGINEYAEAIRVSLNKQRHDNTGALRAALALSHVADDYPVGTVIGHVLGKVYVR